MFDLGPATDQLSRLVAAVRDDQLGRRTPCTDWTVGDLLAHIHQFSSVFTTTAHKQPPNPPTDLVDDWRTAIPAQLAAMTEGWRSPSAWEGDAEAGGIAMPAADNAVVAIEELTVHGWDLARATEQPITVTDEQLDQIDRFQALFGSEAPEGHGVFGPWASASESDRWSVTLAHLGRNPAWSAPV